MKLLKFIDSAKEMYRLRRVDVQALQSRADLEADVIVSLTTIPSRLGRVKYTVLSLLAQSIPAKKIVLWLHVSLKNKVPKSLSRLQGDRFEIRYTKLDSPHCKLVPSLIEFPNEVIVTSDDDLMYNPEWLRSLWHAHLSSPYVILANRFRVITKDESGNLVRYKKWRNFIESEADFSHSIPLGYAGVLYPAGCLHADATNSDIYLELTPKADDLWFKAMGYLNGMAIQKIPELIELYKDIPGSQKISLRHENIKLDRNCNQWLQLCEKYTELTQLGVTR